MAGRDLSVVVFGATGITGRGVAAYLQERAKTNGFKWAVAGRDPEKVSPGCSASSASAPRRRSSPTSATPPRSRRWPRRTKVVLDLVGPYTLYGEPVIEACIAAKTHYADLTGEIPFVREMVDSARERAGRRA